MPRAEILSQLAIDVRLTGPVALHANFTIRGFTALLGRSGAGKTTLLRAIAGLIPAAGTPWPDLAATARPVGYLPQGAALFPHLTALANAAYALRGPDRLAVAQNLLDSLDLGHLAHRPAGTLSGGEAQRVALARALGRRPALLLLDEPSAGLDAATTETTLTELIAAITARGIPALAATHDPAIAARADWLALLAGGKIIREGTPREVFNDPQTTAAAMLLGYQNIWREDGASYAIRAEDISISASGRGATIVTIQEQAHNLRLACVTPHAITIFVPYGRFEVGQEIYVDMSKAKRLEE